MSVCQNGMPPMFLSWENVTVTNDQTALTRGIQIAMGTPPQIVSLRPSTSDDILYVVNEAQCAPEYNATCIGQYGGVFDYDRSTTFVQTTEGQWNGSDAQNPTQLSFLHFNDVMSFGNATIYGYPSLYDEPGYGGQGVLPLGSGSDFLRIAVEEGMIPSTVYGFWTGSRSINFPVDGSLVLGGYDVTRLREEPTVFDSREQCEMCVIITGLDYEGPNGTTSLFSNSSESLQVNLNPSQRVLYVPQNVWENFRDASGGIYNDSYLTYGAANPPSGNVTVTLQNGYTTTIPTEELFYMPRQYNDEGVYSILNDTYQISTIINATNDGYVMDWGIPFLTMNYVIADFKRGEFRMAPAIRTNFENQGGGYALEASCDPVTSTASPTSSSTASAGPITTSPEPVEGGGPNVGAIAGGVVGGVLGLLAIAGGIFFFMRRRRRNNEPVPPPAQVQPMMMNQQPPHGGYHNPPSMYHQSTYGAPDGYGAKSDRNSHWTAMSPTEVAASELGGQEKVPSNTHVNQWLSSQASDTNDSHTVVSNGQNGGHGYSPNPATATPMSGTMERPFEMPVEMPAYANQK